MVTTRTVGVDRLVISWFESSSSEDTRSVVLLRGSFAAPVVVVVVVIVVVVIRWDWLSLGLSEGLLLLLLSAGLSPFLPELLLL